MTHRIRMARKRLGIARERAQKAERDQVAAKNVYLSLPDEAPSDEVAWSMLEMHKKTAKDIYMGHVIRAIERRKEKTA